MQFANSQIVLSEIDSLQSEGFSSGNIIFWTWTMSSLNQFNDRALISTKFLYVVAHRNERSIFELMFPRIFDIEAFKHISTKSLQIRCLLFEILNSSPRRSMLSSDLINILRYFISLRPNGGISLAELSVTRVFRNNPVNCTHGDVFSVLSSPGNLAGKVVEQSRSRSDRYRCHLPFDEGNLGNASPSRLFAEFEGSARHLEESDCLGVVSV